MLQASDQYGELRVTARGLWLGGVSLDGEVRRGVGVLCDARKGVRAHANLLCSQELALCTGMQRGLFVPWQQALTLGRLAVALSPAGAGPGTALARVHAAGRDWLDARAACLEPLPGFAPAEVPRTDVVVINARLAGRACANTPHLRLFLSNVPSSSAVVFDDPLLAFAAATALSELGRPWRGAKGLAQAWRRRLGHLTPRATKGKGDPIVLSLLGDAPPSAAFFVGDASHGLPEGVERLPLTRSLHGEQAAALVRACGATVVVAVGSDGAALAAQLPGVLVIVLRALAQPLLVP